MPTQDSPRRNTMTRTKGSPRTSTVDLVVGPASKIPLLWKKMVGLPVGPAGRRPIWKGTAPIIRILVVATLTMVQGSTKAMTGRAGHVALKTTSNINAPSFSTIRGPALKSPLQLALLRKLLLALDLLPLRQKIDLHAGPVGRTPILKGTAPIIQTAVMVAILAGLRRSMMVMKAAGPVALKPTGKKTAPSFSTSRGSAIKSSPLQLALPQGPLALDALPL
mmetsp:Transcript_8017/g.15471  ORF Transcript_8017/g.15471 Transcript_8017/m.15471 type:complete len:221 (-) Transcript_8017:655-1317(-)